MGSQCWNACTPGFQSQPLLASHTNGRRKFKTVEKVEPAQGFCCDGALQHKTKTWKWAMGFTVFRRRDVVQSPKLGLTWMLAPEFHLAWPTGHRQNPRYAGQTSSWWRQSPDCSDYLLGRQLQAHLPTCQIKDLLGAFSFQRLPNAWAPCVCDLEAGRTLDLRICMPRLSIDNRFETCTQLSTSTWQVGPRGNPEPRGCRLVSQTGCSCDVATWPTRQLSVGRRANPRQ